MEDDDSVKIETPGAIEGARWLTVRGALKLETRGLKRRGRPTRSPGRTTGPLSPRIPR